MIRIHTFVLFLILGVAVSTAGAQAPLTLPEALRLARQNNLGIAQQQNRRKDAGLGVAIARSARLPSVDLDLSSVYLSAVNEIDISAAVPFVDRKIRLGGHDVSDLQVKVTQPIFTGFKLKSAVALASHAALSEEAKLAVATNELSHAITLLYYQAQNLATRERIIRASRKRLGTQLQTVRNLFHAAQVMAFDTLQVYNQMLALQIEQTDIERSVRLLRLQVARLLDLPEPRPFVRDTLRAPAAEVKSAGDLKIEALQMRPELQAVRIAQRMNLLQQKIARAELLPVISAQGALHYAKPALDPVSNQWMGYFTVGVGLRWNLWRWRADSRKAQQFSVRAGSLTLQERELVHAIENEVDASLENLRFGREQLRLAEQLVRQQQERYRIVAIQHQNGVAATNELVTAETDLTRAQLQKQQALAQYHIYKADLERATGAIGDDGQTTN